jgi:hypothetical protein
MQTFPPVEADLILAQAIKLKQTHIQKYDKLEIKYNGEEQKVNGAKNEDKHTPPKEDKTETKKDESKIINSNKKKEICNPLIMLGSDQKEQKERRNSKVIDSASKSKDEKAIIFSADFSNMGSNEKVKTNNLFNPFENGNRINDLSSARKVISSSIASLIAEE